MAILNKISVFKLSIVFEIKNLSNCIIYGRNTFEPIKDGISAVKLSVYR
jgi:hypothetical protein